MASAGGEMVDTFVWEVLRAVHGPSSECEACEAALPETALSVGGWDTLCRDCERVLEPWRERRDV